MIRRPPRSTQSRSSAASDVYKRQSLEREEDEYKSTENKTYYQYHPVLNGAQMDAQEYESFLSSIQNTACLLYTSPSPRD